MQAQANALLAALGPLQDELKKAEREARNAKIKQGAHAVLAFFEAMFPEISLPARGLIYLGDVALDKALGPGDATTVQKYRGDITPGVKQFSEAVHHIPEYSHGARELAEKTGKVATIATFYFDYEEVSESKEKVEKLRELTEKVKDAYDKLTETLEKNKARLDKFLMDFERWTQAVDSIRLTADNVRKALNDEISKAGYSRTQPKMW